MHLFTPKSQTTHQRTLSKTRDIKKSPEKVRSGGSLKANPPYGFIEFFVLIILLSWIGNAHSKDQIVNLDEAALLKLFDAKDLVSIASGYKQPLTKAPSEK